MPEYLCSLLTLRVQYQGVGVPHHSAGFVYHSGEGQSQPPSLGNNDANSCTGAKHQLSTEDHDFPGSRGGTGRTPSSLSSLFS